MPKTTGTSASKAYRAIARPYDALAEKFSTGSLPKLSAEMEVGQSIWGADCNTGLVLQVLGALRPFSGVELENPFPARSIPLVASRTSPDPTDLVETESYVASLIASGDLKATLSQSGNPDQPTILRFTSTTGAEPVTEDMLQAELAAQSQDLSLMMRHLQEDHQRIELSKEYIDFLRKIKKSQDAQNAEVAERGPTNVQDDFDEDMMADLT